MTAMRCLIHRVEWGVVVFDGKKPDGWFDECPLCNQERCDTLYTERNTLLAERGALIAAMRIIHTSVEVKP